MIMLLAIFYVIKMYELHLNSYSFCLDTILSMNVFNGVDFKEAIGDVLKRATKRKGLTVDESL